jgi:hypothetical protein
MTNDRKMSANTGAGGGMYGLGLIGALVYYMQQADSFGLVLLGVLKAILWPAFLVHHLLGL